MSPLKGKLGFRVLPAPPRLTAALVDRFRGLASPNLADAMGRFNFMDPGIRSRSGFRSAAAPSRCSVGPADNLMVHKALAGRRAGRHRRRRARAATRTSAVFGELMCHTAAAKKLGGIVVDGAIRDVDGITKLGFPAFSRSGEPRRLRQGRPGRDQRADRLRQHGRHARRHHRRRRRRRRRGAARSAPTRCSTLVGALMARERARIAEIKSGVLYKAEIDDALRKKGVIE